MLRPFELHLPKALEEALSLYDEFAEDTRIVAGGTDLFVEMHGGYQPKRVISINKISTLKGIHIEGEKVHIKPCTTHQELVDSELIGEYFRALRQSCSKVGSVQTRMRGTLGGNICNAVPSGETLSPLVVFEALVELTSLKGGKRYVPIEEFFTGPKKTVLTRGELLTDIIIPIPKSIGDSIYIKYTRRNAMDLALLGTAVDLRFDRDGIRVEKARIGLTTAAPVPMRAKAAEQFLKGEALTEERIARAGQLASDESRPRSSWRCSEEYRRDIFKIIVSEAIEEVSRRVKERGVV